MDTRQLRVALGVSLLSLQGCSVEAQHGDKLQHSKLQHQEEAQQTKEEERKTVEILLSSGFDGQYKLKNSDARSLKTGEYLRSWSFRLPDDEYSWFSIDLVSSNRKRPPSQILLNFHNDTAPGETVFDADVRTVLGRVLPLVAENIDTAAALKTIEGQAQNRQSSIGQTPSIDVAKGVHVSAAKVGAELVISISNE